jgi:hypothetical protein
MRTDRCGDTSEDEYHAKGSMKQHKYKSLYREGKKKNVKYEMCDYTGNNWSYWNSKKHFTEQLKTVTGKGSMD